MTDWSKRYKIFDVWFIINYHMYIFNECQCFVVSNSYINYSYSFDRNNMNDMEIENHCIKHFTTVCEKRYKSHGYTTFSDYINNHLGKNYKENITVHNKKNIILVEDDKDSIMIGYPVDS